MVQESLSTSLVYWSNIFERQLFRYLAEEFIEQAAIQAQDAKKQRITPRHIMLGLKKDEELNHLFGNADFFESGVVQKICPELKNGFKKKNKKKMSDIMEEDEE